jgi:2-polyprenyl-3-methyl-5-hydroxy-6-metoxy-1,4-benzoquinol methylase
MEEFVWALKNIDRINPQDCRDWALKNFSLEKVAGMYEEYFQAVLNVHTGAGWYEENPNRANMDYAVKHYPGRPTPFDYSFIEEEEKHAASGVAQAIKDIIKPKEVLDIGCGPGMYVKALNDVGIKATGFDIDPICEKTEFCYANNLFWNNATADTVICLEVLEHIDPMQADDCVDALIKAVEPGGTLVFTAAQPGQSGIGHINCRKKDYWLKKFTDKGMVYHPGLTESIISQVQEGQHMGWFVNNLQVFKKA